MGKTGLLLVVLIIVAAIVGYLAVGHFKSASTDKTTGEAVVENATGLVDSLNAANKETQDLLEGNGLQ